jgi:thiol-disulfide isomerase/thioredoxin
MSLRRSLAPLTLAALCAAAASPAQAQDAPRFLLSGHYQLKLNDKPAKDARFYQIVGGVPKLIVVSTDLGQPVLVTAGEKTAVPFDAARLTPVPGDADSLTLAASSSAGAPSAVTIDGMKLKFAVGTNKVQVEPRDPLVGLVTPEQMFEFSPEYRRLAAAYKPGKGDLRLLETLRTDAEVDVFFGSWCPHCEQSIPKLLRVLSDLKNPKLHVRFHAVPNKIDEDPVARQLKVNAVPTGFIKFGGERTAKIEGPNWERPESTLAALLFGDDALGTDAATR